jgi:hypothetical protein
MLLITKRLAEAVVSSALVYSDIAGMTSCSHCGEEAAYAREGWNCTHESDCVVLAAKLLLEKEWGVENA